MLEDGFLIILRLNVKIPHLALENVVRELKAVIPLMGIYGSIFQTLYNPSARANF